MSSVMTVALQFTAIDMVSGIAARVRNSIIRLGPASKEVKKDFDDMSRHITTGLKAIAASAYVLSKIKPGITSAGDLQEAMLGVKMNLAGSAANAQELKKMLDQVESTAIDVSAKAPFSAEDVVRIQNLLLKAGMDIRDVIGESGAAFAATALATLSGAAPEEVGVALANIGTMFKFKGEDYKTFSDWLTRVDDAAATNLPALVHGLRMAGSSAAALGISADDAITALGALSPLGERAGSAFNNFMLSFAVRRKEMKAMGMDFFAGGKFVGLEKATDMLKEKFGGIKDDGQRLGILIKLFGEEGGRAANTFINAEKGFRDIEKSAKDALGVTEKLTIWGEGFNATLKTLSWAAKSTLATLFNPILAPLTKILKMLSDITGKTGKIAKEHKALSYGVSGTLGAGAVGAGAYGIYKLIKGGKLGASVLKGMGGFKGLFAALGSTGAGITKGKAVEAATGVKPVFVTNWPAGGIGGATGVLPGPIIGGGGGLIRLLKNTAPVMLAGAAGWHIGTKLNELLDDFSKKISGGKNANLGEMIYDFIHIAPPEVKNNFNIKIEGVGDGRIKATTDDMNTHINLARGFF